MREIKFRAWNGKEMFFFNLFGISACGAVVEGGHDITGKNIIIMQFSGLKDKNSKEIYEGDIIKFNKFRFDISFVGGAFIMATFSMEASTSLFSMLKGDSDFEKQIEVVGNIYENIELLNPKNK